MHDLMFRAMSFVIKCRDLYRPRWRILEEVEFRPGQRVLDYGCGPGSYTMIAARTVGAHGEVYAQDIHPLAVKKVEDAAMKAGIGNVTTIRSGCDTGLPDRSIDVVLLYDIFHDLSEPEAILRELCRVMKEHAVLSFSDHHLKEHEIIVGMTGSNLFEYMRKDRFTYTFGKRQQNTRS